MHDPAHVVRVDQPERRHAVADHREQRHQDVVDDVDGVQLPVAHIDPADQEQHPRQAEQRDERGVQGHEEPQRRARVHAERAHAALELAPPRVQHVPDIIVEPVHVLLVPALQRRARGEHRVVRRRDLRRDAVRPAGGRPFTTSPTLLCRLRGRLCRFFFFFCCSFFRHFRERARHLAHEGEVVRRPAVDQPAQRGHEEGVLDVGDGGQGRDLGVWQWSVSNRMPDFN